MRRQWLNSWHDSTLWRSSHDSRHVQQTLRVHARMSEDIQLRWKYKTSYTAQEAAPSWHRDFATRSPYKTAYQQPFLSSSHLCSPSILTLFAFSYSPTCITDFDETFLNSLVRISWCTLHEPPGLTLKKTGNVRRTETPSCDRSCSVKGVSITYSECVFVVLVNQHAKRMTPCCLSVAHFSISWTARFYVLTPLCTVLLEKLTGLQLVKKFPSFHGTRRFITALTSVRHLSLSWVSPIQSIYPHPTSWRSILILSTHLLLGLLSGLFP